MKGKSMTLFLFIISANHKHSKVEDPQIQESINPLAINIGGLLLIFKHNTQTLDWRMWQNFL